MMFFSSPGESDVIPIDIYTTSVSPARPRLGAPAQRAMDTVTESRLAIAMARSAVSACCTATCPSRTR